MEVRSTKKTKKHAEGTPGGKEIPHSTDSGLHRWWIILCVPTNLDVFIPPVCKQNNHIPIAKKYQRKTVCFRIVSSFFGAPYIIWEELNILAMGLDAELCGTF